MKNLIVNEVLEQKTNYFLFYQNFLRLFQKTLSERSPLPLGGTSLTPYPIPHPLNQQRFQRGKIPWLDLSKNREKEGYLQNLPSF